MEERKWTGLRDLAFVKNDPRLSQGSLETVYVHSECLLQYSQLTLSHSPHNLADCGQLQVELDLSISANTRKETACKPEIAYGK